MNKTFHLVFALSLAFLLAACGSDPEPDTDGDGVVDSRDAFPQDPTESKDTDGDGVGNNTDVFPQDGTESIDTDGDTVGNNADNCPSIANTNQINTDANFENGDIFGDVCDADDDNDNTLDESDVFPLDPAEFEDEDADQIGDKKDLDLTSPNNQVENSISLTRLMETGRATRFIGPQANANFFNINNKVANAGDVNNDGFDDMLVSIPGYKQDLTKDHYTGIVYLFFGGQAPWPQTIDLTDIPNTVPHVIFEKQSADNSHTFLGFSLAALGDVNGDTIDDFAISAYKANSSTLGNAGAVHIVYGREKGTWLTDAGDDHTISYASLKADYALSFYGDAADANIGFSLANVGDFNGDGIADIAMGQPRYNSAGATLVGRIYILFGGTQFNQSVGTSVDVASIPDTKRVRITGSDPARDQLGYTILPLGNFDNDVENTQDILARSAEGKEYYVLFGQENPPANIELTSPMTTDHGLVIESSAAFLDGTVGHLLADASNTQDILLAVGLNLYIIKGGVGNWPATIDIANLPEEYGVEVSQTLQVGSNAGLAMLPDSNQDGLDEPLISSLNTDDDIGRVEKIENTASWLTEPSTSLTVNSNIQNIMNDDVIENYIRTPIVLGDMNSDGQLEFVLNAYNSDTVNGIDSGDFYIVKGFSQVYPE